MNIAYLDPPYSRYFHELSKRLLACDGSGSVVALLSCPAYRRYTAGDRALLWEPGEAAAIHPVPADFERAAWARTELPAFTHAFSHAVEWFKARFEAERIDVCLVFSDARPFSQAARLAAEAAGVVCLYFERGAFRQRTASLSTQGLNARFCLRRTVESPALESQLLFELPPRRAVEPWLKLRFVGFLLANELACRLHPARRSMQHKRYHFFNYVRIAIKQFGAEHPTLRIGHESEPTTASEPLVIVPLQLPTDSQFVMYSPFRHNQELLDFVAQQVRAALPAARLLVKQHPMDVRIYRLPSGARWVDGNLAHFYAQRAIFVCLNSNVGFEAAIHGKPVLCFADSFYTGHPSVTRVSRGDFAEQLAAAAIRPDDPAAGHDLRAAVLRHSQSPGDVWAYAADDLVATCEIVIRQVEAAMTAKAVASKVKPMRSAGPIDSLGEQAGNLVGH